MSDTSNFQCKIHDMAQGPSELSAQLYLTKDQKTVPTKT